MKEKKIKKHKNRLHVIKLPSCASLSFGYYLDMSQQTARIDENRFFRDFQIKQAVSQNEILAEVGKCVLLHRTR